MIRSNVARLDGLEKDRAMTFRTRHIVTCGAEPVVEYHGTGIGTAIDVECPVCHEREDVTDYGSW